MYLYSYPSTHGISGLAAGGAWEQFEVRLKMTIDWTQRYTQRPWPSEFGNAVGGRNRAYLEIHLEAMIVRTWRPWLNEFGGRNRASLELHLEAVIERYRRWTWRPWSTEFGDALEAVIKRVWRWTWRLWSCEFGGRDRVRLDEYLEAVDGRLTGCWDSIHRLVNSQPWECDKVTLPSSSHGELADGGWLWT